MPLQMGQEKTYPGKEDDEGEEKGWLEEKCPEGGVGGHGGVGVGRMSSEGGGAGRGGIRRSSWESGWGEERE